MTPASVNVTVSGGSETTVTVTEGGTGCTVPVDISLLDIVVKIVTAAVVASVADIWRFRKAFGLPSRSG